MEGIHLSLSASAANDTVGITMLRKSMDTEKQQAAQILETIPPIAPGPSHLGQNIDIRV